MNRLPRRPSGVQPPFRGRSAVVSSPNQTQSFTKPIVRQRPPLAGPFTSMVKESCYAIHDDIHPSFIKLYRKWSGLFKVLDRPWKWLVALVGLVILSMMIGRLL